MPDWFRAAEIQVADELFIAPVKEEEVDGSMIFSNHSCEPNIGGARSNRFCGNAQHRTRRRANTRLGDDRR